jgi:hypothetical protein
LSDLPPLELGYARTELRRRLVEAVLAGRKTASAGPADEPDTLSEAVRRRLVEDG